jgi:hypothetical protein
MTKMAEQYVPPQFEINTEHGNDAGIWICDGSGQLISPCLWMQAVCPDQFPLSIKVKWQGVFPPPKSFRKSGNIPLIYGECGQIRKTQNYLHLFSAEVPSTRSFENESALKDWALPVRMSGIVVVFDKKSDDASAIQSLDALRISANTLNWVKAQQLPFVIAALGYDAEPSSMDRLRNRYGLSPATLIVCGPSLSDYSPKGNRFQAERNIFSNLFGGRRLNIDPEYARHVLSVLCKEIV